MNRLGAPPSGDAAVVAGTQNRRNSPLAELGRASEVRILEQTPVAAGRKRLVRRRLVVSHDSGDQARDGLDDDTGRHFSAGQHVVADRDFPIDQVLPDPMIDALVASAQQTEPSGIGEPSGHGLIETATAGTKQQQRTRCVTRFDGCKNGLGLHHHAGATTERDIIDGPVTVRGRAPHIVTRQRQQPLVASAPEETLLAEYIDELGEDGEDVDSHCGVEPRRACPSGASRHQVGTGSVNLDPVASTSPLTELQIRAILTFLDDTGLAFLLVDAEFMITWASASIGRIGGHDPSDLIGTMAFDHVHPDDLEQLAAIATDNVARPAHYLRGGLYPAMPIAARMRTIDGTYVTCDLLSSNQYLDPAVNGLMVLIRDASIDRSQEGVINLLTRGAPFNEVVGAFHEMLDTVLSSRSMVILESEGRGVQWASGSIGRDAADSINDGPWIDAMATGRLRVISDGELDDHPILLGDDGIAGFRACWSVPIPGNHNSSTGCLVVVGPLEGIPRPFIRQWLVRAAQLLALALERQRVTDLLQRDAHHDPLTGLANRSFLFIELEARLDAGAVTVLFADLDNLKQVNDTFGHFAGDLVLCAAAGRIRDSIRPGDFLARVGGDEFVIACHQIDNESQAETLANRLVERFCEPFMIEGQRVVLGISVGLATAEMRTSATTAVAKADTAMYRAKQGGKGRWMWSVADLAS